MNKIQITPEIKISELLDNFPEIEEKLIEVAPPFKKLRNPVLRKTIAKVTTLRQASKVAEISLAELINNLRAQAGQNQIVVNDEQNKSIKSPKWVIDNKIVITYDARIDLENGSHPVAKVTKEIFTLKESELYLLITPFYPGPLVDIVKEKGFDTFTSTESESEVHTFIKKNSWNLKFRFENMNNTDFYNTLSSNYDDMINFENSLKNKMTSLKKFILPGYKTALDLGCGTGTDSISLSKIGLKVDSVDHSIGMLDKAIENAEKFKIKLNPIQSSLSALNLKNNYYDLIVSLGNTIANINKNELSYLLDNIKNHLNKDAQILFQLVNFARLPSSGTYILNEFESDTLSIIRKYEINQDDIDFIIEQKSKLKNEKNNIVTKLYPHSAEFFKLFAKNNNLKIELFGNLTKEPYVEDKSANLIILIRNEQ